MAGLGAGVSVPGVWRRGRAPEGDRPRGRPLDGVWQSSEPVFVLTWRCARVWNTFPRTAVARGQVSTNSPPVELPAGSLMVLIFVLAAVSCLFGDDP